MLQLASLYTAWHSLSGLSAPMPPTSLLSASDHCGSDDLSININLSTEKPANQNASYKLRGHQVLNIYNTTWVLWNTPVQRSGVQVE